MNDLPLTLVLSWYEQKAVCILLTLLYLGIKNIFLGPTLPAFVSPGVLDILVKNYNITPTDVPEKDLAKALGRGKLQGLTLYGAEKNKEENHEKF